MIKVTGKNRFLEQLLAEELKRKGFIVQLNEETLSKNKWYLCFKDKNKTYVSTEESWQDEDKAGRVLHDIESEQSFFVDENGEPLEHHPELDLALGADIKPGWIDSQEWEPK